MRVFTLLVFWCLGTLWTGCETGVSRAPVNAPAILGEDEVKRVFADAAAAGGSASRSRPIHHPDQIMLPEEVQNLVLILDTSRSMRRTADESFSPEVAAVVRRVIELADGMDRIWFLDADGRALIGGAAGVRGSGSVGHFDALQSISGDLLYSGSDPTLGIIAALRNFHARHGAAGGRVDLVVISDELVMQDAVPLERLMSIGGTGEHSSGAAAARGPAGFQARVHFVQLPREAEDPDLLPASDALLIYSDLVSQKFRGQSYRMTIP